MGRDDLGLGSALVLTWRSTPALRFSTVCSARQNNGPSNISETLIREDGFGEIFKCRLEALAVDFAFEGAPSSFDRNKCRFYFMTFGGWHFKLIFEEKVSLKSQRF